MTQSDSGEYSWSESLNNFILNPQLCLFTVWWVIGREESDKKNHRFVFTAESLFILKSQISMKNESFPQKIVKKYSPIKICWLRMFLTVEVNIFKCDFWDFFLFFIFLLITFKCIEITKNSNKFALFVKILFQRYFRRNSYYKRA